ncbi:RTA1 domain-containing protein [Aspergillus affinis]|uniref:RTA1 domain-containing protein n=1 Tax=Aspergillus affinis TaxID=1070780 RepID=UPI0022FEFE70|nr:RTA1-domain-containing protein [Aspergillus affinis]KAI9042435.1 RTA1-domain-containing protein [Aspergillus affinis]
MPIPAANMVVGEYRLYHYDPSFPAAVAATACFGVLTSIHLVYFIARRTCSFTPFIIGGLCETIGYVGRILNSRETPDWTTGPYIMQTLLLLVAPALFAASIYMILGRLIQFVDGDSRSIIRGRWITRIFVVGDVISFLAQGGGGGVLAQADTKDKQDLGNWIIIAGLAVQIVFFGLFVIVSVIFHIRMVNSPTQRSVDLRAPWRRFLIVLNGRHSPVKRVLALCVRRTIDVSGNGGLAVASSQPDRDQESKDESTWTSEKKETSFSQKTSGW